MAKARRENPFIIIVLLAVAITAVIPIYYVIMTSLSQPSLVRQGELLLLPRGFTLDSYGMILKNGRFLNSFKVTLIRTLSGTALNLAMQSTFAYGLSKRYLPGRKFFMIFVVITMMFNGGIIPTYLVVRQTKIINTIFALLVPSAISAWNVIVLKSFFENIPESLEESARIDGANPFVIFARIVLPLSTPVLATIGLFAAVTHWNAFMDAIIYINKESLEVLQIYLRDMVLQFEVQSVMGDAMSLGDVSSLSLQTSAIFVSTIPMLLAYPFIQKHFVTGMMIGAVKG
ncbi:MAG: carbohydrate ABC transporter permease [Clostridiales bacterium]|jgi:putative aldouronate transport system permease protein|nr:carbohydrate ABC transporter permease [Clostridiales bacterium]